MSKELTENKKKKNRKIEKRNIDEHKDEILQVEEMEKTGEISVYQKIHLGPLPSPETLERYEKICQGAADRIITMAEKEQDYRHKINNKEIDWKKIYKIIEIIFNFMHEEREFNIFLFLG